MHSVLPALPPLLALACAVAALVAGEVRGRLVAVAAVGQLLLLAIGVALLILTVDGAPLVHDFGTWRTPVGIAFVADRLASLLLVLMLTVFAGALFYFFLDEEYASRSRALALVFLLQMGILGALLTGDLFDFYVFFELMGLSAYGLVGYRRTDAHVESALKFAALSLVGSSLMLMGTGAIYGQTGQLAFASLYEASQQVASPPLFLFSIGLVLISLCLKCAVLPLHFWLPDAHSMAPTAISVLLSGAVVKVGAYGIMRLLGSSAPWVWSAAGTTLLVAGTATAIFGAFVALSQRDLKRLLAYSTASQMGYVVAAVALGSTAGVAAALVHSVAHALMKSTLFLGAGAVMSATGRRRWDEMGGLVRSSPLLATALLLAMLSLAGIPPLAGFAGKLAVFSALIDEGAWAALVGLILASALMIYLMTRLWLGICGGSARVAAAAPARSKTLLTAAMATLVLLAGLATGPLLHAATGAADQLFHGEAYRAAVLAPLPHAAEDER